MRAKIGGQESHVSIRRVKRVRGAVYGEILRFVRNPGLRFVSTLKRMGCPVRIILLFGTAIVGEIAALAQQAAPVTTPIANKAAPKRDHAVSPQIAALLMASRPKLEVTCSTRKETEQTAIVASEREKPANTIVRLPSYVVREPRLPARDEVMTRQESESYAMNRFIGPEDGFDRGFLNLFTFAGLWKKIPVLGRFSIAGSETNAERGMRLYAESERKRKMEELTGLMSLTKEAGDAAGADKIKQETEKTFIRRADFGR